MRSALTVAVVSLIFETSAIALDTQDPKSIGVPATLIVDRIDDADVSPCTTAPNDCSLRGAISRANSTPTDEIISFDPSVFSPPQTIAVTNSPSLLINSSGTLAINGPRESVLTISGTSSGAVILVSNNGAVSINTLRVTNGNSGIANYGTLSLTDVSVEGNSATTAGGGFLNGGTATLLRVTISGNSSTFGAGGLYNGLGLVTLINSTISDNHAPYDGGIGNFSVLVMRGSTVTDNTAMATDVASPGGVANHIDATTQVQNSIIAGNATVAATGPDINGPFTSQGYNLIGNTNGGSGFNSSIHDILNPPQGALLGPLSNNGSRTRTHIPLATSPAIDMGNSFGLTTDQRGRTRPFDNLSIPNAPGGDGADIGAVEAGPQRAPFDFDGDGKTDIGISRPNAAREWWINRSGDGQTFALQFGGSTDVIGPADYTGDGKTDITFWRPSTGEWFVLRSEDNSFFAFPFGTNGDVPAPADFDADGKSDFAVFRPSTATWYIRRSTDGQVTFTQFGANGDVPIASDYDGDGKADVAIFRNNGGVAEWWINRSTAGLLAMQFGSSTDKPVVGDYTGDGKADVAFWRSASGGWYIIRSEDFSFFAFPFGANGDVVAPGDYDGDGKFDPTVFRPSSATWFIARSTAGTQIVQFGANGDRPIPNAFVP